MNNGEFLAALLMEHTDVKNAYTRGDNFIVVEFFYGSKNLLIEVHDFRRVYGYLV